MKTITKLFTKAIILEFVFAVITFNIINYLDKILPFLLANGVLLGFFFVGLCATHSVGILAWREVELAENKT